MNVKRRIAAVVVLASTVAMVVSANAGASGQVAKQKFGGTLRSTVSVDVTSLDPITIAFTISGVDRFHAIFGALVVPDPKTGLMKPEIAQSISTPDKGTTWVIKLRSGVKFSDGTVFDANAVKFNWDRQADPALKGVHQVAMGELASYVVTDAQTITVTLKQPNTQWPSTLANELAFIGSPTAIKAAGAGFASKPVAAGPFVLESWTRGSQMVLARNTTYYGAKPFLDKVIFLLQPDAAQTQNAFSTGVVDVIQTSQDSTAQSLRSNANVTTSPQYTGLGIGINPTRAPFNDPNVRRAVALAIDVKEIAATNPGSIPLTTFFPRGHPLYDPSLKYPKTNVAAAQKLINTYVAAHGGTPLKIEYSYSTSPTNDQLAQILQAQLQRLNNLTVSLNPGAAAQYNANRLAQQYSFFFTAGPGAFPEPRMYDQYSSKGGANYFQYSNPTVDAALQKARTVVNADQTAQLYKQAAAQIVKDNFSIPIREQNQYNIAAKSVVLRADSIIYTGTLDVATVSFKKPS